MWTRKIHFSFYFFDDTMPDRIAQHIRDTKNANYDFDVQVWSPARARELLLTHYPEFVSRYDEFPYAIQRSDFSRYAILHAYGGVYKDLDYSLNVPLQTIFAHLDADASLGCCSAFVNETPNNVFSRALSNSFMISRTPKHPFWLAVMSAAQNGSGISAHQRIITGTGPALITNTYNRYYSRDKSVGVLPKQQFNPCSVCERGSTCRGRKGVLACHDSAGSWNGADTKALNVLYCNVGWISAVFILSAVCITFIALYLTKRVG